jgi:hypothetical protein
MILSYSKEKFKGMVLNGTKLHTIRTDENRKWKPGMKIHHWLRNPRLKGKVNPAPHQFAEGVCDGVEEVVIVRTGDMDHQLSVNIGGHELSLNEINTLAINDGFVGLKDFRMWFVSNAQPKFSGRIIHFTSLRYGSEPSDSDVPDNKKS